MFCIFLFMKLYSYVETRLNSKKGHGISEIYISNETDFENERKINQMI